MNTEHTVESLIDAIRTADSLEDLYRLIGPTDAERARHETALATWDRLQDEIFAGGYVDPDELARVEKRISFFERTYC